MSRVISAVKDSKEFAYSLNSGVDTIFFLYPDIMQLKAAARKAHEAGKSLFIHIDLTTGLGKDRSGIEFAARCGIDGIISTRANLIRIAKECGLQTVQRFFIVDSHSIDTTVESIKASKTDFAEVMPGISPKIIEKLRERIELPIIAGGLIDTEEEVKKAIDSGAYAVSTGCISLW